MYKKAFQTHEIWAFAYEIPTGGYALTVILPGTLLRLEDKPQFEHLQSLQTAMKVYAPLEKWSEEIFDKLALN